MNNTTVRRQVAKTASYTLQPYINRSGTTFSNRGATGSVTFTLPKPGNQIGQWFEFRAVADQSIIIAGAGATDIIAYGSTTGVANVGLQIAGKRVGRGIFVMSDGTNWFAYPAGHPDGFTVAGVEIGLSVAQDAITAHAGGGQGSATAITGDFARVTTVATRGDSVLLPASGAGVEVILVNAGANPMAVFPQTGDAINGLAANASVTMIPNETAVFVSTVAGQWYAEIGMGVSGSIPTDIYRDTITAFAGGGQASATLIDSELNRISTVATAGDSIKLPVSAAGMGIIVINHGGNPMQVFGSGTDTIDDVATATGVSQMNNSVVLYFCVTAGAWYTEGLATGYDGGGRQTVSFTNAITAFAGGGQASATTLTSMLNRVTTVATAGDSVKLPAATVGLLITLINSGANDMQVFGAGTDTVDGVATATGVAQPSGTMVTYSCVVAGAWTSSLAAQQTAYGLNRLTDGETLVADSNATVTAAQLLKGFLRSIPTAARTWTLDTATNLDNAIPAVKTGHNFTVYVNNNSAGAFSISFTAGAGMTFFPAAGVTIAQNKTATLTFFRTGAAAWSVYHQVGA